jgi:hypothetical protein
MKIILSFLLIVACLCQTGCGLRKGCVSGDCTNGQGTYIDSEGAKFIGKWEKGKLHDEVTCIYPDGTEYNGQFYNGRYNGYGVLRYKVDEKIFGSKRDFNNWAKKFHRLKNRGDLHYTGKYNGSILVGITIHADDGKERFVRVQRGNYIYRIYSTYRGEFKDGKQHGHGILLLPDGTEIEGEFYEDKFLAKEIKKDGRFIAYNNGVVLDNSSGLMWAAKDNGEHINWLLAKQYCENYRGGGYTDWRMPTQNELKSLYDGNYKQNCDGNCCLTKLINVTKPNFWTSEKQGSSGAVTFSFNSGYKNLYNQLVTEMVVSLRVLPVRDTK